jgi:pyruvate dehydrogenase (quinone)/pyruvate oxidase
MADTAAGILLDTLYSWGVDVIFGLPGDGINGIMEGLRKRQEKLRFIQVRHEEAAAFMACGYSRFAHRLGACLATSGHGGIHLVSGLYNAKIENLPVVAVTGHHYHDVIGTHTQQDVDLTKLFTDVAIYSERVMGPAHIENVAHVACRNALGFRGVAHINVPTDIQDEKTERRSGENVPHHQSAALHRSIVQPTEQALRRAADALNEGRRIVLLCGKDALHSSRELLELADTLAAPILCEELGQTAVPSDSAYCVGCLGLLGAPAARQALAQCDTLFLIGASVPYSEAAPLPAELRVIELSQDFLRVCPRHAIEVSLTGEITPTLRALLPMVSYKQERDFVRQARQECQDWQLGSGISSGASRRDGERVPLHVLARELTSRLPGTGILVSDPGRTCADEAMPPDDLYESYSTMPSGLPYILAAQVAHPERECVAVLREPSFSMLMGEFATAVKYRLPIRVLLVKDRDSSFDDERVDFAAFARSCGGAGFTMHDARDCGDVLDRAFAETGPVLVAA